MNVALVLHGGPRTRARSKLPRRHGARRALALGLSLLGAGACSSSSELVSTLDTASYGAAVPADLYGMDHRLEIQIDIDPRDWEALRFEGRDLVGVFTHAQTSYDYTFFDASVTIDGVVHEHVGVRKKGFWGSLSAVRPSLKLDFDRFVPEGSHLGVEKLTLNNDLADPSRTHECLAYALFTRAGLPAPRCNLAHVTVNGTDLGTYSNVEPIDERMLARHFDDPTGNLYEGQLSDFVRADLDRIELKTNERRGERSDLSTLADALEADDATLVERLAKVIDLDRFRDFWVMEILTGHWDGYANNANNYLAYHDPGSGRFHFLPWGTDGAFEQGNPKSRIYARGRIASRLYALPEQQRLFWSRLAELTETVWDAQSMIEHVDRVATLAPDAPPHLLERERQFIETRAERLRAVLDSPPPRATSRKKSACEGALGEIRGRFATTMASAAEAGVFDAELSLDGEALVGVTWSGQVTLEPAVPRAIPGIRWVGRLRNEREVTLQLYVEPSSFAPGARPFHGVETSGIINVTVAGVERFVARIGTGSLRFGEASDVPGAPVSGSFEARTYQVGCAWR